MIFKTAWINKDGQYLLKINFDDTKGEVWVNTTEAVHNFAKKTLRSGDVVEVQYTEKNGEKNVDRISKVASKESNQKPEEGKESKKDTYSGKTGFDSELSKRQTCMNATASVMQSLVGQVDPNNVTELMETIYKKALGLLNL